MSPTTSPVFRETPVQERAGALMADPDINRLMLYGGSRSGKTFKICHAILARALAAPNSRHAIVRKRFNAVKRAVGLDTLPTVARLRFPGCPVKLDRQDWFFKLPNGSEIWLLGLDDAERVEKVLGMEFATIAFNECSELSFHAVETALTRLAQTVDKLDGRRLRLVAYFDCNPPGKSHWTYRYFVLKVHPKTRLPLANAARIAWLQMNPSDNRANLDSAYFETLEAMSAAKRKRYLEGDFSEDAGGALWTQDSIDAARIAELPQLSRIVVAVDPSGAGDDKSEDSDDIGIVAVGMVAGKPAAKPEVVVLEDASLKASPLKWGRAACNLADKWQADAIVGEVNYGGAMVEHTIKSANGRHRFISVRASRGKHIRAEPVAAVHEDGRSHHYARAPELEDQLCGFLPSGYIGEGSPDRADAFIWAVTELTEGATRKPRRVKISMGG